jgi:hypothetical protein
MFLQNERSKNMRINNILIILICFTMVACFPPFDKTLMPEFTLADTLDNQSTVFHSGESFQIHFSVINSLPDTLVFTRYDGGPLVRFMIMQEDSVIASSVDGWGFVEPVFEDYFPPGDTIRAEWQAPTTPQQSPKVVLTPGVYKARVISWIFNLEEIPAPEDIPFSVIQ